MTEEEALNKMNKVMDGRLESDIPLNDAYWKCRDDYHLADEAEQALVVKEVPKVRTVEEQLADLGVK